MFFSRTMRFICPHNFFFFFIWEEKTVFVSRYYGFVLLVLVLFPSSVEKKNKHQVFFVLNQKHFFSQSVSFYIRLSEFPHRSHACSPHHRQSPRKIRCSRNFGRGVDVCGRGRRRGTVLVSFLPPYFFQPLQPRKRTKPAAYSVFGYLIPPSSTSQKNKTGHVNAVLPWKVTNVSHLFFSGNFWSIVIVILDRHAFGKLLA